MPAKKFSLLSQPPQPLPDDEAPAVPRQSARAAETPQASARAARAAAALPEPVKTPAATTIRLHRSAAEPLNEAWLNERRLANPKLSYPEFASRIVQLGLAAYAKEQARRA